MSKSDPLQILLAHDRWATRNLLNTCCELSPGQFAQKFSIGPGSLQETTTHILGAMQHWTRALAGTTGGVRLEHDGQTRTPQELLTLLEPIADAFASEADRLPLHEILSATRGGVTYQFTRGVIITHVTTHGMHHRAQCLNMLRQLGVTPLPPSSVTEWSREGE